MFLTEYLYTIPQKKKEKATENASILTAAITLNYLIRLLSWFSVDSLAFSYT